MDAGGVRSLEERLSLQQGHRVQQLPLAVAYRRAEGEDRVECPSHLGRKGLVSRLFACRSLRPHAHAEGAPSGSSPERPSRDGSLRLCDQDDGERVRGGAVQDL